MAGRAAGRGWRDAGLLYEDGDLLEKRGLAGLGPSRGKECVCLGGHGNENKAIKAWRLVNKEEKV